MGVFIALLMIIGGFLLFVLSVFALVIAFVLAFYPEILLIREYLASRKAGAVGVAEHDKAPALFVADPKHPNRVHFFVGIQDQRIVPIQKIGGDFAEFLLNSDAFHFQGEGKHRMRWRVIPGRQPRRPFVGFIQKYRAYIRRRTGLYFIGVWPFRKVDFRPLEKQIQDKSTNRTKFVRDVSITGHLRVQGFPWYWEALDVDIRGAFTINIHGVLTLGCRSPYETLYEYERWDIQTTNTIKGALFDILKEWDVDDVLARMPTSSSSKKKEGHGNGEGSEESQEKKTVSTKARLEKELFERLRLLSARLQTEHDDSKTTVGGLGKDEFPLIYGNMVINCEIIDVEPQVTAEDRAKLQAEFYAERLGNARVITRKKELEGDSAYTSGMGRVVNDNPAAAFIQQQETERAYAGGKNTTVIRGGQGSDPATLAFLDKISKNTGPKEEKGAKKGDEASS